MPLTLYSPCVQTLLCTKVKTNTEIKWNNMCIQRISAHISISNRKLVFRYQIPDGSSSLLLSLIFEQKCIILYRYMYINYNLYNYKMNSLVTS